MKSTAFDDSTAFDGDVNHDVYMVSDSNDKLARLLNKQCRQLDELTDLLKQYLEQQEKFLESLK